MLICFFNNYNNFTYFVGDAVSIGQFLKEKGDEFLRQQGDYLGSQNRITIEAPLGKGSHEREMLTKAYNLLYSEDDKFNYIRLWVHVNFGGKEVSNGYIFSSSDFLWQQDVTYAMNKKKATVFLRTLNGIFPKETTWPEILRVTHRPHLCFEDRGQWVCDCKGYWTEKNALISWQSLI